MQLHPYDERKLRVGISDEFEKVLYEDYDIDLAVTEIMRLIEEAYGDNQPS